MANYKSGQNIKKCWIKSKADHIWINDMSNNKIDSKIVICDITDHLPIFYVKYGEEKRQGYTKITYRPITENLAEATTVASFQLVW